MDGASDFVLIKVTIAEGQVLHGAICVCYKRISCWSRLLCKAGPGIQSEVRVGAARGIGKERQCVRAHNHIRVKLRPAGTVSAGNVQSVMGHERWIRSWVPRETAREVVQIQVEIHEVNARDCDSSVRERQRVRCGLLGEGRPGEHNEVAVRNQACVHRNVYVRCADEDTHYIRANQRLVGATRICGKVHHIVRHLRSLRGLGPGHRSPQVRGVQV
mmetsp:Transcript_80879/g.203438  ORF Transcript_80879/g.203438 Transcript_80879/m.203438 type:complete len:216 (-) Transcript_80879:2007-2654(-)